MNKKLGIITLAISSIIMTGCTQKPSDKISQNEQTTLTTDTEKEVGKEQEKTQDQEQKTYENENIEVSLELKTKKEQYLDRMQEIYEEYEKTRTEFEVGNLPNSDMRDVILESYEGYDKILNEIYQDLKKYLPEEKMQNIKQEQLNWITEKEDHAKYLTEISTPLIRDQQILYMTEARCKELLDYLSSDTDENDKDIVEETKESNISTDDIINDIYKLLGESRDEVEYIYSPNDNYVSDPKIKNDYYIFQINTYIDEGDFITSDHNLLVNKSSYEVYNYYPDGSMDKIGNLIR